MQTQCSAASVENQQKITPAQEPESAQGGTRLRRARTEALAPWQTRMRADMAARGYSPLTQRIYERAVRHLARHCGNRSPEQISVAEAQSYLRQRKQRGVSLSTIGSHTAGIRFLFNVRTSLFYRRDNRVEHTITQPVNESGSAGAAEGSGRGGTRPSRSVSRRV